MSDESSDKNLGVVRCVFEAPTQDRSDALRLANDHPLRDRIASGEASTLNLEFDLRVARVPPITLRIIY
jgi:hypothetical protein